jgi:hypothetical protein
MTHFSNTAIRLLTLKRDRKTQDALNFVHSYDKSYHTFWIHCGNILRFEEDCRRIAKLVKPPGFSESDSKQDTKRMVTTWLESETSGD